MGEAVKLLQDLIGFLRADGTSRRAVYNSLEWMRDLPEPTDSAKTEMLASLLAYQFDRQAKGGANAQAPELAHRLAQLCAAREHKGLNWLANFMGVAEFLARETRTGTSTTNTTKTTETTA